MKGLSYTVSVFFVLISSITASTQSSTDCPGPGCPSMPKILDCPGPACPGISARLVSSRSALARTQQELRDLQIQTKIMNDRVQSTRNFLEGGAVEQDRETILRRLREEEQRLSSLQAREFNLENTLRSIEQQISELESEIDQFNESNKSVIDNFSPKQFLGL